VYLVLLKHGALSVLEISRILQMGRTKVYRILDKVMAKELVTQQVEERGLKFAAAQPSKLKQLLHRLEGEVQALGQTLPSVVEKLEQVSGLGVPGSKVLFYRGQSGLSRVNWNLLRARGELLSYEVSTADAYLPQSEAEQLRQEIVNHKLLVRTIMNEDYIKPFTKVTEMVRNWWQIRQVPEPLLAIKADVFIYNDVFAMCHYLGGGDVFCVETYNGHLSHMQRQLFEHMWQGAKPFEILNDQGEARVGTG
jgi:hypothetical protein